MVTGAYRTKQHIAGIREMYKYVQLLKKMIGRNSTLVRVLYLLDEDYKPSMGFFVGG